MWHSSANLMSNGVLSAVKRDSTGSGTRTTRKLGRSGLDETCRELLALLAPKRLARRTICFSCSAELHEKVIAAFIKNICSTNWSHHQLW